MVGKEWHANFRPCSPHTSNTSRQFLTHFVNAAASKTQALWSCVSHNKGQNFSHPDHETAMQRLKLLDSTSEVYDGGDRKPIAQSYLPKPNCPRETAKATEKSSAKMTNLTKLHNIAEGNEVKRNVG
jgi:hypothetical protein